MNHPAAEIVAIALRKICKLANNRKWATLLDESKEFLASIQKIIPPLADKTSSPDPSLRGEQHGHRHTVSTNPTVQVDDAASDLLEVSELAETPGDPSVHGSALGDALGSAAAAAAAAAAPPPPPTTEAEAEAGSLEKQDTPTAIPLSFLTAADDLSSTPMASQLLPDTEVPVDVQPEAAEASTSDPAPAPAPPPPPLLPDLVPRTDASLSDDVLTQIIRLMRLAVETEKPNVIEVALDCVQKLVAFQFMQGTVYVLNVEKAGGRDGLEAGERALAPTNREAELRHPLVTNPQSSTPTTHCWHTQQSTTRIALSPY